MRLGIYGGSFDPIHHGHLLLAEQALDRKKLDRVEFVPLGVPPHRKHVRTPAEDRLAMTLRAIAPYPEFSVNRFELDSEKTSYTVDTLRHYRRQYPTDELFLIVSSETFNDIPNWRSPGEICELVSLIVARRGGYPPPNFDAYLAFTSPERVEEFKRGVVAIPTFELSSTDIRERVAAGESIRFLTPDVVIDYIREKRLYLDDRLEAPPFDA